MAKRAVKVASFLRKFADVIRAKPDWVHKILDGDRELAKKWTREVLQVTSTEEGGPRLREAEFNATIDELKHEARRIRALDYSIQLHSLQIPAQDVDWQSIDKDVLDMWKYANSSTYGVRTANLRIKPSIGIYVSDGLVPKSLHENLSKMLDTLATFEPKDFHPGTGGQVQDLIHPSLYPYTIGLTEIAPGVEPPQLNDGYFITEMSSTSDYPAEESFMSTQSWIPSVFVVNKDATDAHIESYINGLGKRENFPDLYRLVEKAFVLCLPHFGKTLTDAEQFTDAELTPSERRFQERAEARTDPSVSKKAWEKLVQDSHNERAKEDQEFKDHVKKLGEEAVQEWNEIRSGNKTIELPDSTPCDRFKNQKMKVIVKAANYILKPGQEYEGSWHIEGMPHERVIASAIYYYSTDSSLSDEGLGIRRFRNGEGFPNEMDNHTDEFRVDRKRDTPVGSDDEAEAEDDDDDDEDEDDGTFDYPSDWEGVSDKEYLQLVHHVTVGAVPTTNSDDILSMGHQTGRIISFPNFVQHKVLKLKNEGTETAIRKILCFFLVEDNDQNLDTEGDSIQWPGFTYDGVVGRKVLTTSDVPIQAQQTNFPTLRLLLARASQCATGKALPNEMIDLIFELGQFGVTIEKAEALRRLFMDERRPPMDDNDEEELWNREFSLCEH